MNSLWLNEKINNKNFISLDNDVSTDVCVIGAGIFGLTCGYYLSKLGLKTAIIDKNIIGRCSTGHTTAKITSQHGLIYNYLFNSYGEKFARDYLFANEDAIKRISDIIKNENINCDFEKQSSFVYTTDKNEIEKIKKEVDCVNKLEFPANFSTKMGLPFEIEGSIHFRNQAQFNPTKYIMGLYDSIIKNNGAIYTNTTVYDIKFSPSNFSVLTTGGIIKSKYVIIASHYPFINFPGMYFLKMYQSSSYVIGIDAKKTLFNGMYISSSNPIYSFRVANYNSKKILLLGGCSHKTGTPVSNQQSYLALENYAKNLYPQSEILFRWSTRDCITLDKIPYIGRFSNFVDNIFIGTGFNKWGMTSSNVAANIICDKILGNYNKYSYVFDSTRLRPIKNKDEVKNMLSESINSLVIKKLKHSNISFDDIPNNSGEIIDIKNQKVGIYKDNSRKYICCKTYLHSFRLFTFLE